jgi:ABC-type multidrug transport system fused ATPase/permease subunit
MNALFRMREPEDGSIIVDDVDIRKIGLHDLRTGLSIIPQEPVLFSGNVRYNLDPFGLYDDIMLWDALDRSNLKQKISEMSGGLEAEITEGGDNLSIGQRQLLCLARAFLKKPKILIMDEVTANVDYETDTIIQKCLREDFVDATILTIAHRLNTIIDYDRVLVLDKGAIVEFDSPHALLQREGGVFRGMVEETGSNNADLLRETAKSHHEKREL